MNTFKRYLLSSLTTFLTAFFGSLAIEVGHGLPVQLTGAFVLSLILIAVRAGFKFVVEGWVGVHADV